MIICRILVISFFLLSNSNGIIHAQEANKSPLSQGNGNPSVIYIGKFPDENQENLKQKFGKRLLNFIAGKKYEHVVSKPVAVYASGSEDIWILDQGNRSLIRFDKGVGEMPQFRSKAYKFFPSLVGITPFKNNKILFTDSYHNKIFYFIPGKKGLFELNDTLQLRRPTGICYSPEYKSIWVVETSGHRISIFDEEGNLIKRMGERGSAPGQFNFPTSIWIDDYGKVFIIDALNYRIQVFSIEGEIISIFGKQGDATGYFARPKGIATDSEGNIYIVDALFNTVQIFDLEGNFLENFGSHGRGEGEFWMPNGIYIDEQDYIYVADTYNSRIQVFRFLKGND